MAQGAPSLTEQLSSLLLRPVDAAARERAGLLLVDWLGCASGALREDWVRALREWVQRQAVGSVDALGGGRRDPMTALTLNAALGNVLEMDDVHRTAILHPGPVVMPVALLQAQLSSATSDAFLDAVVRGYEATIRVGRALGRQHYAHWHPTSTAGAFGAAAAAGSLLGLDAEAMADALGNAGTRTGGLWRMRHEQVPSKSLHNAWAAITGWQAAQFAQIGLRGPRGILEGEQGLFAATAPDANPDAVIAADADWLIHQTSVKPWPACRHAHPAMDALQRLLAEHPQLRAGDVARVDVGTYREAVTFCDRPQPTTTLEAKFSLQHALAAILRLGPPEVAHYQLEAVDLASLRQRIHVSEDAQISARFPAHYGACVRVQTHGGETFEHAVVDAQGDPEQPMDAAAIRAKAQSLMQWGGLAADDAAALLEQIAATPGDASVEGWLAPFGALTCRA